MRVRIMLCPLLGLLLAAGSAAAQAKPAVRTPGAPPEAPRGFLAITGGYQATSNTFSDAWAYDYYADQARVTANYPLKGSFLFDAGGGVRLVRRLFVGANVSRYNRAATVAVTASVPHPFFYQMRDAQGTDTGLGRTELGVHLQAMWLLQASPKIQVGLFGGPSYFSVEQVLATKPNFSEAYPYDTVTMTGVATERQTKTALGYNVGADITYRLTRQVGVGMLVRLARANVKFQSPDKTVLMLDAGGAQVGAGIRLRF